MTNDGRRSRREFLHHGQSLLVVAAMPPALLALLNTAAAQTGMVERIDQLPKNIPLPDPTKRRPPAPRPAPRVPTLAQVQNVVRAMTPAIFNAQRGQIEQSITRQITKSNLFARGVTLYNVNMRLGNPAITFPGANRFELRVNNNHLYFKSTQPTALGKWADPAFEVNADLVVRGVLAPFSANTKPRVSSAVSSVTRISVKSRNVSGGAILGVANQVVNAFRMTGTGKQMIEWSLNNYLTSNITRPVNAELAKL